MPKKRQHQSSKKSRKSWAPKPKGGNKGLQQRQRRAKQLVDKHQGKKKGIPDADICEIVEAQRENIPRLSGEARRKAEKLVEGIDQRRKIVAEHPQGKNAKSITWGDDGSVQALADDGGGVQVSASGQTTTVLPIDALDIIDGDTFSMDFMGEVMVDGENQAIDGIVGECDEENHPFAECYTGSGSLCCRINLTAEGEIGTQPFSCGSEPPCNPTIETLSLNFGDVLCGSSSIFGGFDPSKGYYSGPFPIGGYPPAAESLVVWCDGGTVKAAILDSDNCLLSPDPIQDITWDSATFSGEIELDPLLGGCCHNGELSSTYKILLG